MEQTERDWDSVIDVNLQAPFILTQAVAKRLMEQQKLASSELEMTGGSVVNISSIIGKVGNLGTYTPFGNWLRKDFDCNSCAGQANYAASKAGLIGVHTVVVEEGCSFSRVMQD